ncbi:hypothetical protein B0T24DRAFT_599504 [Lasiosphaeria ovina]|uniref:Uncharacterized protein n=1 Tax=Lasiosphaeria ovina TaxID=92902 RepID=A0AAE0JT95_9PEZI|nr:hypothetical protein B0T24DRAFT_599504 [Lasiosphaeria ovina]
MATGTAAGPSAGPSAGPGPVSQPAVYDWSLIEQAIDSIRDQDIPVREESRARIKPSFKDQKKNKRKTKDGTWVTVEHIPPWTDPVWQDLEPILIKQGKDTVSMRREPMATLRPALREGDKKKKPTIYAQRFGINSQARPIGRSRMSPTRSTSRKVDTPFPGKKYIDMADVEEKARELGGMGNFIDFLAKHKGQDNQDVYYYMKKLIAMMHDDADYQRIFYPEFTTDERERSGLVVMANHIRASDMSLDSDLTGPLHPLVERHRWVEWLEDRGEWSGDMLPMYWFDLFGATGELSAPALQLVSRVLRGGHPFWRAVLDIYSRRPITMPGRDGRDPAKRQADGPLMQLKTDFDPATLGPDAMAAKNGGYDSVTSVKGFLNDRLTICIRSGHRMNDDRPEYNIKHTYGQAVKKLSSDAAKAHIRIQIAAEALWPLLVPVFNQAEKAACCLMLASTILHELAHAAHFASGLLCRHADAPPADLPRQLQGLNDAARRALRKLFETGHMDWEEPYWDDEPVAELGWAFEKQLWGGGPLPENSDNCARPWKLPLFQAMAVDVCLERWPGPGERQRQGKSEQILLTPPLPIEKYMSFVPLEKPIRLFKEEFWSEAWPKYGHRALNLYDGGQISVLTRGQRPAPAGVYHLFGRQDGRLMMIALSRLEQAGYPIVHMYLTQMILDRLQPATAMQKWRYLSNVWPLRSAQLSKLLAAFNTQSVLGSQACQKLVAPNSTRAVKTTASADMKKAMDSAIGTITDIHNLLVEEIQQAQIHVREFLTASVGLRQELYKLGGLQLYQLLHDDLEETIDNVAKHINAILDCVKRLGEPTDLEPLAVKLRVAASELARTETLCRDTSKFLKPGTRYLTYTGQVFGQGHQSLEAIGHSQWLKRVETLEKLAAKEILLAPPVVRDVIEKFFDVTGFSRPPDPPASDSEEVANIEAEIKSMVANRSFGKTPSRWDATAKVFESVRPAIPLIGPEGRSKLTTYPYGSGPFWSGLPGSKAPSVSSVAASQKWYDELDKWGVRAPSYSQDVESKVEKELQDKGVTDDMIQKFFGATAYKQSLMNPDQAAKDRLRDQRQLQQSLKKSQGQTDGSPGKQTGGSPGKQTGGSPGKQTGGSPGKQTGESLDRQTATGLGKQTGRSRRKHTSRSPGKQANKSPAEHGDRATGK